MLMLMVTVLATASATITSSTNTTAAWHKITTASRIQQVLCELCDDDSKRLNAMSSSPSPLRSAYKLRSTAAGTTNTITTSTQYSILGALPLILLALHI